MSRGTENAGVLLLVLLCVGAATLDMPSDISAIFQELSWPVKLMLLKDYIENINSLQHTRPPVVTPKGRRVAIFALQMSPLPSRRQTSMLEHSPSLTPSDDEKSMKMKLFRLMYETVRDSDLKVKRAELIKHHYSNSTAFEIGYLMGDITDKYNVMTDVALTLKKFYGDWKPIEHINAYEQIANQAIEINHLTDIMRSLNKKNNTNPTFPWS